MKSTSVAIGVFIFLFSGCVPSSSVILNFPEPAWRAPGEPMDLVAGVKDFTIEEGTPESFSTYFSFWKLVFEKPLVDQVTETFRKHLKETKIFQGVVEEERKADIIITGHIKKSNWRETGSLWDVFWLSSLTFDLYPLVGGSLAWPEAEIELIVTLSRPSGERFRAYSGRGRVFETISMYGSSRVTPAVQLSKALGDAIEEIERKIYNDGRIIIQLLRPPGPPELKQPEKPVETPEIVFVYPSGGIETPYSRLKLIAEIKGELRNANYRIYLNNIHVYSGSLGGNLDRLEREIRLMRRKNVIRLVARNIRGGTSEKEIVVTCNRPDVNVPDRWLAVFSTDESSGSERAVSSIIKTLMRHPEGGFARSRVLQLHGKSASKRKILAAIRLFLGRAGEKDEVYILYAGRGISIGSMPEMNFLTCANTNVRDLEKTAISLTLMSDTLKSNLATPTVFGVYFLGISGSGESTIDHGILRQALSGKPAWSVLVASTRVTGDENAALRWWEEMSGALTPGADADKNAVLTLDEAFQSLKAAEEFNTSIARFGEGKVNLFILSKDW
ncbi:MAG: hypothetical protein ACYS8W_04250 [Planctomycetota bacterium]|jgi:hypothetical protein